MQEDENAVEKLLRSMADPVVIGLILDQVLFGAIASTWIALPNSKPELQVYHLEVLQAAFGGCLVSGAFENFSAYDIAAVYTALTGKNYDDLIAGLFP